jgi:hypothetical protein
LLLLDLKGDDTLEFQNIYEITFPQFSGGRPAAPNGNRTITLTTPDLPTSERERLTASYRERLKQVEQEIRDIAQIPVTDRMLWRCHVLARLQLHQEFFALENLGLMLLANDVKLGKEHARLHQLVESAMRLQPIPGMDVYYQLPDTVPDIDPATESTPPGDEVLFQEGRSPLESLIDRFHFQAFTRDDGKMVLESNVRPIILDSEYEDVSLEEILQKLFVEAEVFDSFSNTADSLDVFIEQLEVFGLFQTENYMRPREVYEQLRLLKEEFRIQQGYVAQFKAILGSAYEQFSRAIMRGSIFNILDVYRGLTASDKK